MNRNVFETRLMSQQVKALFDKNLEIAKEEAKAQGEDIHQFYENRPWEFSPHLDRIDPDRFGLIPPPKLADALKIPVLKTIKNPNDPWQQLKGDIQLSGEKKQFRANDNYANAINSHSNGEGIGGDISEKYSLHTKSDEKKSISDIIQKASQYAKGVNDFSSLSKGELRQLMRDFIVNISEERRKKIGTRIVEDVLKEVGNAPSFQEVKMADFL